MKNITSILLFILLGCNGNHITENATPTIELIFPNGGEIFNVNDSLNVRWQSKNVDNIHIILCYDEHNAKIDTIANISPDLGQYSVTDLIISDSCMIRIEDAANSEIFDETASPFKISKKSITLILPVGGEVYNDGDTVLIKWKSTLVKDIQILRKRTNVWEPFAFNVDANKTNEYRYPIYIGSMTDFWIKVMDTYDHSIYAVTDSAIKVIKKELTLLEPNGKKAYVMNQEIQIKWNHTSLKNEKINISISYNDGNAWETIVENINSKDKNYIFQNQSGKLSNKCRIKIEDVNNSDLSDFSDDPFAFYNPAEFDKSYFPLQIGNMWNWQKNWSSHWGGEFEYDTSYYKVEIIAKEMLANIEYYKFETTYDDSQIIHCYYRINEENGIVYKKENLNSSEQYFIQLSLPSGNYIIEEAEDPDYNQTVRIVEDTGELFGNSVQLKHYLYHHWISGRNYSLAYNFGNVSNQFYDDFSSISESLKGCVINNAVFGDTTFVIKR